MLLLAEISPRRSYVVCLGKFQVHGASIHNPLSSQFFYSYTDGMYIVLALFEDPELTQVSSVFLLRLGHTACACAFLYQEMPYQHADYTIPCGDCSYMDLLFSRL